ncbi:aspartate 1-decarboxylase autocleavage activator PanM [Enterobacteriaceae bacterium YMB-R22]|jgi:GNAT superfamily N-acetyltransferase|uniref:aspartate 1-decarboxylase autocleavage activator PanM n=1 Tax=Tenebrionicola larvae TaxID=2815733 RepID=UPI00201261D8|nr:aspartate 1-decarboxylase autocleavage activator PanM [Tenebrionicola larvae]MBV4413096.1 aspartate 1-decarboxylase autocleavage activator PanM [Tenebrionicola larvae]
MKLTIVRLRHLSEQDILDLTKIWPEYSPKTLTMDDAHRIYAAKFNNRLLAAVKMTLRGAQAELDSLRVREATRRRGVGRYLLEELIRDNPGVNDWRMVDTGVEDRSVMAAFMQASGFRAQTGGWQKQD